MKIKHYPHIRAEMAYRGLESKDMADALDISPDAWRSRMRGKVQFRYSEMKCLMEMFESYSFEDLFYDPLAETGKEANN